MTPNNREYILGLAVDNIGYQNSLERIEKFVKDGGKHIVVTPYAESVIASLKDEEYREIVNNSSLSVPDGGSLLAAAEYLSNQLPKRLIMRMPLALVLGFWVGLKLALAPKTFAKIKERVSGADLVISLCRLSAENGWKVYFLGGSPGAAAAAAGKLRIDNLPAGRQGSELKIRWDEGPRDLPKATKEEIGRVTQKVNAFAPDFLFVAFKPVEQEKWLAHHLDELNAKVFMAVGGAFDMISGKRPRAPLIFRRLSLEWLWRLFIEPQRVGRIFNAVIVFPLMVFKEKIPGV